MRLLLTFAGISNTSIYDALVDLRDKPIAESRARCIPTAAYAMPGGAGMAWRLICGSASTPLCELGWRSLGDPGAYRAAQYQRRTLGPRG